MAALKLPGQTSRLVSYQLQARVLVVLDGLPRSAAGRDQEGKRVGTGR